MICSQCNVVKVQVLNEDVALEIEQQSSLALIENYDIKEWVWQ